MEKFTGSEVLSSLSNVLAVAKFSIDGKIEWANSVFLEMFGYDLDDLTGQDHSILLSFNMRRTKEYKNFWNSFKEGKNYSSDFKLLAMGYSA